MEDLPDNNGGRQPKSGKDTLIEMYVTSDHTVGKFGHDEV